MPEHFDNVNSFLSFVDILSHFFLLSLSLCHGIVIRHDVTYFLIYLKFWMDKLKLIGRMMCLYIAYITYMHT